MMMMTRTASLVQVLSESMMKTICSKSRAILCSSSSSCFWAMIVSVLLLFPSASALITPNVLVPPTTPAAFVVSSSQKQEHQQNPGFFFFQHQQDKRTRAGKNDKEQVPTMKMTMNMNRNNDLQETFQESQERISTLNSSNRSQQKEEFQKEPFPIIAYKEFQLRLPRYDNMMVPVATWFQPDEEELPWQQEQTTKQQSQGRQQQHKVQYSHRISVPRIASLLAGINFIPPFVAKDFSLTPTISTEKSVVIDGENLSFPTATARPVVILAHGFLGSRFDLSHLAEELASQGFVCLSPEYPESLASSYVVSDNNNNNNNNNNNQSKDQGTETSRRIDRTTINQALLQAMDVQMKVRPTSFGIVGHSLGCGTVTTTGDDTWTRVCIAGPPVRRDGGSRALGGNILAIASLNDGLVTRSRLESMIPMDFVRLEEGVLVESLLPSSSSSSLSSSSSSSSSAFSFPEKSILILDRPDAPNHISFLAGNANDAMVSFLSPLLPVAQALSIPVLDFDKYKVSRDSDATAKVVIPIVSAFLRQHMTVP